MISDWSLKMAPPAGEVAKRLEWVLPPPPFDTTRCPRGERVSWQGAIVRGLVGVNLLNLN